MYILRNEGKSKKEKSLSIVLADGEIDGAIIFSFDSLSVADKETDGDKVENEFMTQRLSKFLVKMTRWKFLI